MSNNLYISNSEADRIPQIDEEEVKTCRICFAHIDDTEIQKNLAINPCNCQQLFAFAHNKCINERLQQNGHQSCDVCRFMFIMDKKPKTLMDWIRTKPNVEEWVELLVRVINVSNVSFIGFIVWFYNPIEWVSFWTICLVLISCFRVFWVSMLFVELLIKSLHDLAEWKTKNFRIKVKQNPGFNRRIATPKKKREDVSQNTTNIHSN